MVAPVSALLLLFLYLFQHNSLIIRLHYDSYKLEKNWPTTNKFTNGCKLQGLEFNFLEGRCKYIPGKVNLFPTVYW